MTTRIPALEQFLVFWIDPVKTLEAHGDDDDPELVEAVSKLPFKRYVGQVRMVRPSTHDCGVPILTNVKGIFEILPNLARPWEIYFLSSGEAPICPAVHLQEDMFVAVEPSTRTDLSDAPLRVSPELPWADTILPTFFSCGVLCHSYDSDATPSSTVGSEDIRRGKITRLQVERRDQLLYPEPVADVYPEPSLDDIVASGEIPDEETSSMLSNSESYLDPVFTAMMTAIKSDPLATVWWSMVDTRRDLSEWPYVQLSPDLSLVDELPNPFEFARECQVLSEYVFPETSSILNFIPYSSSTVAAHKAKKIIAAQQKDELDYGHVNYGECCCGESSCR